MGRHGCGAHLRYIEDGGGKKAYQCREGADVLKMKIEKHLNLCRDGVCKTV